MRELLTVFWLRRRLAVHELSGVAGAVNLAAGIGLMAVATAGALAVAAGLGVVLHLAVAVGDETAISVAWSIGLYTVSFFALGVPLLVGAGETGFDPSRLLGFPVTRRWLHHLSLASELLSKIHLAWYPSVITLAVVGVVAPGPARTGPLFTIVLFVAALVVWSHALLLIVRRVLRRRRLRELAAVIGLALVVLVSFLPATIDLTGDDADRQLERLFRIPEPVTTAAAVLPPSITARALADWRAGHVAAALTEVLFLGCWMGFGWLVGRAAFEALMRTTPARAHRTAAAKSRISRLASSIFDRLPPVVGAVAAKDLRYLLQSGVGRLDLVMMPLMTALPAVLIARRAEARFLGFDLGSLVLHGVFLYAAALTGYLQVNSHGWEKTGFATYFTSPSRPVEVILGKNLGVWIFNALLGVEGLLVWSAVSGFPAPSTAISALALLATTSVLLSFFGNFTSVAFPVARPIAAVTSAASPIGTLVMIGCLLLGLIAGTIAIVGAEISGAVILQPVIALGILGAIALAYRWSLVAAANVLDQRRDEVLRAISAGPAG